MDVHSHGCLFSGIAEDSFLLPNKDGSSSGEIVREFTEERITETPLKDNDTYKSNSAGNSPTKTKNVSPTRRHLPFEVIVKENASRASQSGDEDEEEEHFLEAIQDLPMGGDMFDSLNDVDGHIDLTEEIRVDDVTGDIIVVGHRHTEVHRRHGAATTTARRRRRNQGTQADLDLTELDDLVAKDTLEDDDELEVEIDEDFTACFPSLETAKEHGRYMVKRVLHASWKVAHFNHLPEWMQDNDFLHTGHRPPLPSFGACFKSVFAMHTETGNIWSHLLVLVQVLHASWKVAYFNHLPEWMQDNDFLHTGHRPPLPSFGACFKSVFAMHTETGNIWSHLLGCVAFIGVAAWFWTRPLNEVQWQEKVVFSAFFLAVIGCLGLSTAFHTVSCHSHKVTKLFSKLDYVGISLLIVGSFVPWLFYGFYCRIIPKIVYITSIIVLGSGCITVSLFDKFSEPNFRAVRAGMFVGIGLSGVVPFSHYAIVDGFASLFREAACHWIILMAALYIGGAALYALRVPERFFPGKCDLWFQSHQIFHLCVVVAAFVHYHGITELAVNRLQGASCEEKLGIDL